eukprot:c24212_g5_i1 orf=485-742(+)
MGKSTLELSEGPLAREDVTHSYKEYTPFLNASRSKSPSSLMLSTNSTQTLVSGDGAGASIRGKSQHENTHSTFPDVTSTCSGPFP